MVFEKDTTCSSMFTEKEGFKEMLKVVCSMLSRNECLVFRDPVDWKSLGLLDYPEIVLKPMDLGTIKKKIENADYGTVEDIATDIRLVWSNCMLYNRDGSEFYHLAGTFARGFEEAYSALQRLEDSKSDNGRIPSVEERMQLSYDIFKIDNTEMARVLTIIEASCPNALSRKAAADEVLINLDALAPKCFHEVNSFTLSCLISGGIKKKKRPTSTGSNSSQSEFVGSSSSSGDIIQLPKKNSNHKKMKT